MNKSDSRAVDNMVLKMQYLVDKHVERKLVKLRALYAEEREPIIKAGILTEIRSIATVASAMKSAIHEFHLDGESAGILTPRKPLPYDGNNSKITRFGKTRPLTGDKNAHDQFLLAYLRAHPRQRLSQIKTGLGGRWDSASVAFYLGRLEEEGLVKRNYEVVVAPTAEKDGKASVVFEVVEEAFCSKCGKQRDAEGFCPDYKPDANMVGNGHDEGNKDG